MWYQAQFNLFKRLSFPEVERLDAKHLEERIRFSRENRGGSMQVINA